MVVEVNNTFGERRIYFLKESQGKPVFNGQKEDAVVFTDAWPKDFHVSPFNSRKGSYTLTAHDPLSTGSDFHVDNTIILGSSKDHAKIVARLFSVGAPLDPLRMSLIQKLSFIVSWWWVGFVTYPRIVKEAGKLFFRRSLHVWFRPEVVNTSIGRRETDRERQASLLEPPFMVLTRSIVSSRSTSGNICVKSSCSRCDILPRAPQARAPKPSTLAQPTALLILRCRSSRS